MPKNIDGIKKLNSEEVKKYRKIILDYIGEKEAATRAEEKNKLSSPPALKKVVDGISFSKTQNKIEDKKKSFDEAIKKQQEERKKIIDEEKQYQLKKEREDKEWALKERQENEERLRQEKIKQLEKEKQARELIEKERKSQEEKAKQGELKKKEIIEQAKLQAGEKRRAEESKKLQEKIKLEERESEEKRRAEENLRLEKIKRREELKEVKLELQKAKQAVKQKQEIKRRKAINKLKKNLNQNFKEIYNAVKKNIVYVILFSVIFLALSYIIFCLAVLRFNQFNIIKQASGILPVPAVITSEGLINYNDFKNIKNSDYSPLSLKEKKNILVEWLILKNLSKKYSTENNLDIRFALDENFNRAGLSRIKKIKELLNSGNLMEPLSKYADEYSSGSYYNEKAVTEKFGSDIIKLAVGQASDIISLPNGFYIIERIENKNGQFGVKYIFIRARTLEQYINDKLKNAKIFILAN